MTSDITPDIGITLAEAETRIINTIDDLDADDALDNIVALHAYCARLKELAKNCAAAAEAKFVEMLEAQDTDIQVGDVRYYVGTKKTTKCQDKAGTIIALLEQTSGDFGDVAECLSSQPFKHGTVKGKIDEQTFDQLFTVEEQQDLKEGKPKRGLQVVNTRFIK